MRCRMCNYDFCWVCGSFGKGDYHPNGICRPNDNWHLGIFSPDVPLSHVHSLRGALHWDRQAQEVKDRIRNVAERCQARTSFKPEDLGYPRNLSIGAVGRAEGALLEAAQILKHVHVMLHASQCEDKDMPQELDQAIKEMVRFAGGLHGLFRVAVPNDRTGVASPSGTRQLSRKVNSMAGKIVPIITRLHSALKAWGKNE